MDSAWPLLLFLIGLVGAGVLMLICGIQSHEAEREGVAESVAMPGAAPARSFFATIDAAFACPREVDDDVLRNVERRVRQQTEVAARFVQRPSIDRLHEDDAQPVEPELSLFCRIQKFLELERQLVGEFVSDPSLARLHGRRAMAL